MVKCKKKDKKMKKNFKLGVFLLALTAMAGCSEDIALTSREQVLADKNNVIVTVPELEEYTGVTRAGFAEAKDANGDLYRRMVWKEGDMFKLYSDVNWRNELYRYMSSNQDELVSGGVYSVFKRIKGNTDENTDFSGDKGYAFFPISEDGTNSVVFNDEDRKTLTFTLDNNFKYSAEETSYEKDGNAGLAYICPIPMWGYAENRTVEFNYLTAFLRINLQGYSNQDITIVADAQLNGTFTALFDGTTTPLLTASENTEVEDGKLDMSGMMVDEGKLIWLDMNSGNSDLGDGSFDLKDVPTRNKITISVEKAGDKIVYVPVMAQGYKYIAIYVGDDCVFVKKNVTLAQGKFISVNSIEAKAETEELTSGTTEEITKLLKKYADFGREVTVELTGKSLEVSNLTTILNTIYVPTLKNNVTLKFKEAVNLTSNALNIVNATDAQANEYGVVFEVTSITGSNGIVVNTPMNAVSLETSEVTEKFGADVTVEAATGITLSGDFSNSKVDIKEVDGLSLAGTFGDLTTEKIGGEVAVEGVTFTKDVNIETAENLEFAATLKEGAKATLKADKSAEIGNVTGESEDNNYPTITVEAASVDLSGEISNVNVVTKAETTTISGEVNTGDDSTTNLTTEGDLVVEGSLLGKGKISIDGNVTIEETGRIRNGSIGAGYAFVAKEGATIDNSVSTRGGSVELNGQTIGVLYVYEAISADKNTIVLNNVKVREIAITGANVQGDNAIEVNGGSVGKVNIRNNSTLEGKVITLNNVDVTTIENEVEDAAKVHSTGSTVINTVSGAVVLTSDWTADTDNAEVNTLGEGYKIYTAAQLKALQSLTNAVDITLATDVTVKQNAEANWKPAKVYEETSKNVTFDGGGHTVAGITIKANQHNFGFFSKFAGSGSVTVKDLKLTNVKTNIVGSYMNIGGLVGYANTTTNIEGVMVQGESLGTANSGGIYRVGGLIGTAAAGKDKNVTVTNTTVDFKTIYGHYEIGGLVGSIANNTYGNVILKADDYTEPFVKVKNIALSSNEKLKSSDLYGRVGMIAGAFGNGGGSLTQEGEVKHYEDNILTSAKKSELGFDNNTKEVEAYGTKLTIYYVGQEGNYVGYSPKFNGGKVLDKTYAAGEGAEQNVNYLNMFHMTSNKEAAK